MLFVPLEGKMDDADLLSTNDKPISDSTPIDNPNIINTEGTSKQKDTKEERMKPSSGSVLEKDKMGHPELYIVGLLNIEQLPGWKDLDWQIVHGSLDAIKAEMLKNRLKKVYDQLLKSFEWNKKCQSVLSGKQKEQQQTHLEFDRVSNRQFQENIEIGELKRELTKGENEVALCIERENQLNTLKVQLELQKKETWDDIETQRKHKSDLLEPGLLASTKELKVSHLQ